MENEVTLPPVVRDPLVGTTIQDRYRIIEKLGEGGMGTVYLGEHMMIKRKVAIKCLHGHFASHPEAVARFHREALAATAIGNEHIVEVTDMGTFNDGTLFMVLEYLEGHDFSEEINKEGPQSVGRVVHIVCQMCDALTAVHAKGIVHRDLKPENIFLVPRGDNPDFVKILDFGISKFKNSLDGKTAKMTATGSALGSPYYMSPEQAEGRDDVDHQTDLYALGCIMFNALTGRQAFEGETLSMVILNICTLHPPSVCELRTDIPTEFGELIQRLLAKDKEVRFATAAQVKEALLPYREVSTIPPSADVVNQLVDKQKAARKNANSDAAISYARTELATDPSIPTGTTGLGASKSSIAIWVLLGTIIVATLVLVGVLFGAGFIGGDSTAQASISPPEIIPTAVPTAVSSTPEPAPKADGATVQVKITTVPENAEIFLDGSRIANPFDGEMPKSISPRLLEARAQGYDTVAQELVLQFSQKVVLKLETKSADSNDDDGEIASGEPKTSSKQRTMRNKSGSTSANGSRRASAPTISKAANTSATKTAVKPPASASVKSDNGPDIKKDNSGLKSLF